MTNTKNPLVSVLLCARNEEDYISATLVSLTEQDFNLPYEIVVVDNDSNDKTPDIARRFTPFVYHCSDRGKVPSMKKGLPLTHGEIIAIADADTIYPSNWLSSIVSLFSQSAHTQLVFGSSDMGFTSHYGKILASYLSSFYFIPSLHLGVVCSMGFNLAMRRSACENVLRLLEPVAFSGWGTGTLTLKLYGRKSIKYSRKLQVPKCMRRYTRNGFGATSSAWLREWVRLVLGRKQKVMESEYFK
jgi:glycosyltransferase involved in cell wall biosynthesis